MNSLKMFEIEKNDRPNMNMFPLALGHKSKMVIKYKDRKDRIYSDCDINSDPEKNYYKVLWAQSF